MKKQYTMSKIVSYGIRLIILSLLPVLMMSSCDAVHRVTEPESGDESSQNESLQDEIPQEEVPQEAVPMEEVPLEEATYCQGDEILCLESFTPEAVQRYQAYLHGGDFHDGAFTPSNRGGLEFEFSLDTHRDFVIEIELDGNIANSHVEDSQGGGKVTLFELNEIDGPYLMACQRMNHGYRGTGVFRTGPGYLITTADLSGAYSMSHWGNEPHTLTFKAQGENYQMTIDDDFTSRWERGLEPHGVVQVRFMFGNRIQRIPNQHCITNFRRLKIAYV